MKYRHILIVGLVLDLAVVALGSNHPYITDPGTLLDGFENVNDWTVSGTGATAENDTSIFKFGNQSIKLNAVDGNVARMDKTLSLDLSSIDNFSLWVYITDISKLGGIMIYLSSEPWSKYFSMDFSHNTLFNCWNHLAWAKSDYIGHGDNWSSTMVRLRIFVFPVAGQSVSVNFDDFRYGVVGQPKVIITFDDGNNGQINKAYPIMAGNSQAGVAFINSNSVGVGYGMTLANLITLRSAGWDISNHTAAHKDLTSVSQEEMEADIDEGYDWLVANGFGNTAKFFAYPGSKYNDTVITKLKERHILARASGGVVQPHFDFLDYGDLPFRLNSYNVAGTTSVAIVQEIIDKAITEGALLILLFHQITDSGEVGYLTADFQAISDYLKEKQDAGLLEVITFSDYYNALIEEPFCLEKPQMDFNGDCKVDFKDLALFTQSWLECNLEPKSACWE